MALILEIVLQFLGEILLQLLFEFLAELGFRSLADIFKKPKNGALSTIGFVLWGAIAGAISLWIFPRSPISDIDLRKLNIVVTPLLVGGIMMLIGRERSKRGQMVMRLDRFGYAFVFALSMAVIRYVWAK